MPFPYSAQGVLGLARGEGPHPSWSFARRVDSSGYWPVVQRAGGIGRTPAAAKHAVMVTVELVAPAEVIVFTTVTLHVTSYPAPVEKEGGLHWLTAGALAAAVASGGWVAEAVTVAATQPRITMTAATPDESRTLGHGGRKADSSWCDPISMTTWRSSQDGTRGGQYVRPTSPRRPGSVLGGG